MKDLKEVKQKLNKSILATIGQNKCCDSLPAINKAFDILIKETAECVCDKMMYKYKKIEGIIALTEECKIVKKQNRIKKQILKEL